MNIQIKHLSRRYLALNKRDKYGLEAIDRMLIKRHSRRISLLCNIIQSVKQRTNLNDHTLKLKRLKILLVNEYFDLLKILVVEEPERPIRASTIRITFASYFTSLQQLDINLSENLRFRTVDELGRLMRGFQIPETVIANGYKFGGEEIIVISLLRLSWPMRWSDVAEKLRTKKRWALGRAFYWFLDFMVINWAYLLLNNMEYWLDSLEDSAECIRTKLANLLNHNYRQYHPPANDPISGFTVALFIDNTLIAMSRPGGVLDGGENAPRVPREIQQAWYTGWKKLHGMKWQSVILANGMDFNLWGPVSMRKPDITNLIRSQIQEKLRLLQQNRLLKFKIHGDSAYSDNDIIVTANGHGMAACRETIEWSYKDLKTIWKYCDYKHVLKIYGQPVGKIVFVCMLLRNAHVTVRGSQVREYFNMLPPTLEEWLSQGPQAHPIPQDSIFSPDYQVRNIDSDDESDDDEDDL